MITLLLSLSATILISFGLYRIVGGALTLPSSRMHQALKNLNGKRTLKDKAEAILVKPLSRLIGRFAVLSEYRQKQMESDFNRLERKDMPQNFVAMTISRSIILGLFGLVFIPLGIPWFSMLAAVLAVLSYFRTSQGIRKKVGKLNREIEMELPRMVETLNYSLKDNRDLVAFFEKYRKVAGRALGQELDKLVFDMKTGNHGAALRNLDARLMIPQLSALVSILCGVHQGIDQRTSLLIIEQDIRTQQRERLRREAEKRPGRIKTASFILTVLMILMFMVPLVLLIFKNLQSVGF